MWRGQRERWKGSKRGGGEGICYNTILTHHHHRPMNNQRRSRESSVWFPPPQLSSQTPFSPHPHFHHTLNPTPTTPSFSRPFPSRAQRKTVYARPRRLQPSCCPQRPVLSVCVGVQLYTLTTDQLFHSEAHTHAPQECELAGSETKRQQLGES